MKSPKYITALVAVLFSTALLSSAADAQTKTEVPWRGLAQALDGRVVNTVLLDGTALRGRILEVSENELRLRVKTTSKPSLYPKGEIVVPRGQTKVFSYTYRNGTRGRVLGSVAGGAAGTVPTILLGVISGNEGGNLPSNVVGVLAGIVGAGAALGYGLGHAVDTKTMTVYVAEGLE
jgi:hypothetical protein